MKPELPKFPTMLRKMWSGTEVQQWIDENIAPLFEQAAEPEMKTPSDPEIVHLAYEHCDETDANGEEPRFTSQKSILEFARALLAKNNHQNAYTQGFHDGVKAAGDVIKKIEQETK